MHSRFPILTKRRLILLEGCEFLVRFFLSILPHSFWRHFHNPCLRFVSFLRLFPVRSALAGGELSIVHTYFFGPQTFFFLFFPLHYKYFSFLFSILFPYILASLGAGNIDGVPVISGVCIALASWLAGWLVCR